MSASVFAVAGIVREHVRVLPICYQMLIRDKNKCNICKALRVILTNVFSSSSSLGDGLMLGQAEGEPGGHLNQMDAFGIAKCIWRMWWPSGWALGCCLCFVSLFRSCEFHINTAGCTWPVQPECILPHSHQSLALLLVPHVVFCLAYLNLFYSLALTVHFIYLVNVFSLNFC